MNGKLANLISLALIAVGIIVSAFAYPGLSAQVPTHWNAAGEVDGWSPRHIAVLIGPGTAALGWLVFWLIPRISPRGFRTDEFNHILSLIQVATVVFALGIGGLILLAGHGQPVAIERIVPVACGLLFMLLGNYMGKMRKNFFVGIRTPWTLASDEVWARTHRLGGYLFVAAGLVMIVSPFAGLGPLVIAVAIVLAALVPIAYSFIAYQRLEGFGDDATS